MKRSTAQQKTPAVLVEEVRAIVASNAAGSLELLTRVGTLLSNTARAAKTMPTRAPDASRAVTQGLEALLSANAIINTHSLAMLNELVAVAEDTLAVSLEERSVPTATSDFDAPADLQLKGRVGERATGQFVVDNEYDSPVQTSFTVSTPGAANVLALPQEYVMVSPKRALIPAKGSTTVRVTVDVTDELVVGRTYAASIRVVGFEAPGVTLRLTVLSAAPTDRESRIVAKSAKSAKSAKRAKRPSRKSP